jgi:pyruvate carboxylase
MQPLSIRVLVLGDAVSAKKIAQDLTQQGYQCITAKDLHFKETTLIDDNALKALLYTFLKSADNSVKLYVHPGVSLWSYRPGLESIANWFGIQTIACSSRLISLFSNLVCLEREAELSDLNILSNYSVLLSSAREVEHYFYHHAHEMPFILQSINTTGYVAKFLVKDAGCFSHALPFWIEQMRFMHQFHWFMPKQYMPETRCIKVPFVRFNRGLMHTFAMVDASLQDLVRDVIQVCPQQYLNDYREKILIQSCNRFAEKIDFVGVGVFYFLVDAHKMYFVGGCPGIDFLFPLWEKISQVSALEWQLASLGFPMLAKPLLHETKPKKIFGVSASIYSEDSILLIPQLGVIKKIYWQDMYLKYPNVSLYLNVCEGQQLETVDSGMLGFMQAISQSYETALQDLSKALSEVFIVGTMQTNQRFLIEILEHAWVKKMIFSIVFLEQEFVMSLPNIKLLRAAARLIKSFLSENSICVVGFKKRFNYHDLKDDEFGIEVDQQKADQISGEINFKDGVLKNKFWVFKKTNEKSFVVHIGCDAWIVRLFDSRKKRGRELLALTSGKVNGPYFLEQSIIPEKRPIFVIQLFGRFVAHQIPKAMKMKKVFVRSQGMIDQGMPLAEFESLQ